MRGICELFLNGIQYKEFYLYVDLKQTEHIEVNGMIHSYTDGSKTK